MHQRSGGTDSCKALASMVVYVREERSSAANENRKSDNDNENMGYGLTVRPEP